MDAHELVSRVKALALDLKRVPTLPEFYASGVTRHQMEKSFRNFSVLLQAAALPTYHKDRKKHSSSPLIELPKLMPEKPFKILFIDIETSLLKLKSFRIGENYIQPNQIEEDWKILSFAAKFHDEETMHYLDLRHEKDFDDSMLLTAIQHLFSESSIVIGHNVAAFDIKKINARMVEHDMEVPQDYKAIDTLKIARKHCKFSSNKLEYLAKILGCTPKSKHKKFQGMELWDECDKHNPEAWEEMELYNRQDVHTLIEVWEKLRKIDNSKVGKLVNAILKGEG